MATDPVYLCQGGCGKFFRDPSEMEERGMVNPALYCADCLPAIDRYLVDRDALHDRIAKEWADGLFALMGQYAYRGGVRTAGLRLPDE